MHTISDIPVSPPGEWKKPKISHSPLVSEIPPLKTGFAQQNTRTDKNV